VICLHLRLGTYFLLHNLSQQRITAVGEYGKFHIKGIPVGVKKLRSFLASLFAAPEPKRNGNKGSTPEVTRLNLKVGFQLAAVH